MGSLTATKLLQALVGALLVPVVARLGRMSFGAGVAVLAAAFVAFDPVSTWYAAHFWAEPVFVLLLWFGIERVVAGDATGRLLPIATGGLAIGLAALTREPALYVLPLVAAWVALGRRKRSLLQAGLLLAVALLTVAPWTARNYARYSAFVPVSTMGGRALLEGNADRDRGEVYAEYDEVGGELGPIAQHRFAMQEGLRAIRARQPTWLFEKLAQEVPHLLTADNMVLVHVRRRGYGQPTTLGIWLVALVTVLPYLAVMGLFVLGLARLSWSRPAMLLVGFLLVYTCLHVVVHGHHRFRLPMLPAIFLIAASAVPAAGAALAPFTPCAACSSRGSRSCWSPCSSRLRRLRSGARVLRRPGALSGSAREALDGVLQPVERRLHPLLDLADALVRVDVLDLLLERLDLARRR